VKTPGKKGVGGYINKAEADESNLASFLRGFGDVARLSPTEAISQWESFASNLGKGERRELEDGGYASGCFCALSYTNPTKNTQ
jgi:hypothetical protein